MADDITIQYEDYKRLRLRVLEGPGNNLRYGLSRVIHRHRLTKIEEYERMHPSFKTQFEEEHHD